MCERYVLPAQDVAERELVPDCAWWRFAPSFNVAPSRYVPAVRVHDGQSEGVMMRWGLIPAWARGDASAGNWLRLSSATLENTALFRGPWLNGQRCILPFAGFYIWRLRPIGYRQPYFVYDPDRSLLAVAGVWDRTETDDGDVIEGFAILMVPGQGRLETTQGAAQEIPAIIRRQDCAAWLRGTPVEARALLQTQPDGVLSSHPVSPRINSLACDDAELVRAVDVREGFRTSWLTNSAVMGRGAAAG